VRDGPYDTVIVGHVLEHDPDPAGLIETLESLLTEDGRMLISVSYGYQPSADHHHSFYFDNLYTLISRHLGVADLRMLSGSLTCVAVRRPESAFEFGRRTVTMIEDVLEVVQHENHDLKAELASRSDDVRVLKEKLSAQADEVRRVRGKLKERAEDVQRLKARLEKAKVQPTNQEPEALTTKLVRKVTEKMKGKASGIQPPRKP
jgi:2-polyprenyl-3-methyl-5-hydroxy-6-metoxy-1,4-benzoquinol methylase